MDERDSHPPARRPEPLESEPSIDERKPPAETPPREPGRGRPARRYQRRETSPAVRDFSPAEGSSPESEVRLTDEEYARARAVLPVFCLDGLLCARDPQGPFVVLAVRADHGPSSGPFRGEPWVIGGRWDRRTPWEDFVRRRAAAELFGGFDPGLDVDGPIGDQLFATSWSAGDGPFGRPGLTLQLCYRVISREAPGPGLLQPDDRHSGLVEVRQGDDLERYHPYVRDVIERSGWLDPVPRSP